MRQEHEPIIAADYVAIANALAFAPCFEVDVDGPVPLGSSDGLRYRVLVHAIIQESGEAAANCAMEHVQAMCRHYEYPFDPDEWDVVEVRYLNQN